MRARPDHSVKILLLLAIAFWPATFFAQTTTYSQQVEADTFVSSGQPDANFGTLGAMEIGVPTLGQPRTLETLLRFDTTEMRAAFDADYGSGNWVVIGATLSLFSNVATAGQQPANERFNKIAPGGFEFDLLSNDNWNEMSITWNTLSDILPGPGNNNMLMPLGAFFWDANGQGSSIWTLNANSTFASQIYGGNPITIFGQPTVASSVGYLFNTLKVDPAFLNVTVTAVPEPSSYVLVAGIIFVTSCRSFLRAERRRQI